MAVSLFALIVLELNSDEVIPYVRFPSSINALIVSFDANDKIGVIAVLGLELLQLLNKVGYFDHDEMDDNANANEWRA